MLCAFVSALTAIMPRVMGMRVVGLVAGLSCIDPDTLVLPNCFAVLPRYMKTMREESEEIMEQTIHLNAMRSYWDYDDRLNKSDHTE